MASATMISASIERCTFVTKGLPKAASAARATISSLVLIAARVGAGSPTATTIPLWSERLGLSAGHAATTEVLFFHAAGKAM